MVDTVQVDGLDGVALVVEPGLVPGTLAAVGRGHVLRHMLDRSLFLAPVVRKGDRVTPICDTSTTYTNASIYH
jgi:hypothetical protein